MKDHHEKPLKPVAVRILEKTTETSRVCSFLFKLHGIQPVPGQFFMIWVPGVDEIPMSISSMDNEKGIYQITVAAVGDATNMLCQKNVGDLIGVRGPFGNGFHIDASPNSACILGGGVGTACVNPLVDILKARGTRIVMINAGRTEKDLLFHARYQDNLELGTSYFVSTDDGSCGERCFGHELLVKLLEPEVSCDMVYTCGPELMMHQVFLACKQRDIPMEASLERMMRCGNGVCGLCGMDPEGMLVCKDGPVFNRSQLERVSEFGQYHRDFSGCRIPFGK